MYKTKVKHCKAFNTKEINNMEVEEHDSYWKTNKKVTEINPTI